MLNFFCPFYQFLLYFLCFVKDFGLLCIGILLGNVWKEVLYRESWVREEGFMGFQVMVEWGFRGKFW